MLKDGLYTAEADITEALPDGRAIQLLAKGATISEVEARRLGFIKDAPVGPTEIKAGDETLSVEVTSVTVPTAVIEPPAESVPLAIGANATNPRARKTLK